MPSSIPIIRLEIENMRHSLQVALSEYILNLDKDLQAAIDAFCTPDNLGRIIKTEVDKVLTEVITHAVWEWFQFNEGQDVVRAAVRDRLKAVFGPPTDGETL